MYLMEIAGDITERIQEIAFGLSIIISGLFLLEYKRFTQEQEKQEMIDGFLNDNWSYCNYISRKSAEICSLSDTSKYTLHTFLFEVIIPAIPDEPGW